MLRFKDREEEDTLKRLAGFSKIPTTNTFQKPTDLNFPETFVNRKKIDLFFFFSRVLDGTV